MNKVVTIFFFINYNRKIVLIILKKKEKETPNVFPIFWERIVFKS